MENYIFSDDAVGRAFREALCARAAAGVRVRVIRDWFGCLYQVLLGQQEGPRFGGFVALYGVPGTIGLVEAALAREATPA
jgi:lysyl-tRNA synthetase class 1